MEKEYVIYYPRALVGNGGPTVAMWSWVKALKAVDQKVTVICDSSMISNQPLAIENVPVIPIPHNLFGRYRYPCGIGKYINKKSILILHSAFSTGNLIAAYAAEKKNAFFIITPHGAYNLHALKNKEFRKRIWLMVESRFVSKALGVHTFVEVENQSIHNLVPDARIITVPTGIEIPTGKNWEGGGQYVAWFGRYDIRTKGLDILIKAYSNVPDYLRLPLRLHGRNSINTREDVCHLVKDAGLQNFIEVNGPIEGEEKIDFLRKSQFFIMPSRYESFSIALLEALALNVPCLVSERMPIAEKLRTSRAAILVKPQVDDISNALVNIFNNFSELQHLTPQLFVKNHCTYEAVGSSFIEQVDSLIRIS